MFVLPEPVPTEHRLKRIKPNALSSQEFSPYTNPRVTQANIAHFLEPVPNTNSKVVNMPETSETTLRRWTELNRQDWVDRPGQDAYFMFDMFSKFTVPNRETDPRYMNRPSIFPRSFKYELDCFESRRKSLLEKKMEQEEAGESLETTIEIPKPLRWQEPPKLFAKHQDEPCVRRASFAQWGQNYRSEACNFYYKHYPAPVIKFRKKKFV